MNKKYIIKRPERTDAGAWHAIEGTLMVYGNLTRFENREYVWEKTSDRKTLEIVKGLDIEIRHFKKSDEEEYGEKNMTEYCKHKIVRDFSRINQAPLTCSLCGLEIEEKEDEIGSETRF